MASIVETKAVSLRKGNHSENMAFTGVQGETVADLGYEDLNGNLGTDSNTTLRLHNGITKGGIPMARADLLNVSSEMLAENRQQINDKNLAYADLSNIEKTEAAGVQNKIKTTMMAYGLAEEASVQRRLDNKVNLNTDNLNTSYLVSNEIHNGLNGNKPLAYKDTSNINTADLVNSDYHNGTPEGNKPLAYRDTTNINTADLANSSIHNGEIVGNDPLAYANSSNVDTTNLTLNADTRPNTMSGPALARADLANVDNDIIDHIVDTIVDKDTIERIYNKDGIINEGNLVEGHYPETKAIVQYIDGKVNKLETNSANTCLSNVKEWNVLYGNPNASVVNREVTVTQSDGGFRLGENYETGIYLINDETDLIYVQVFLDSNNTIESLKLQGTVGNEDLTSKNPFYITSPTNVNATFTITSTQNQDNTYTYEIDSITSTGSGFEDKGIYVVNSSVTNTSCKVIYNALEIVPTSLTNITDEDRQIGEIATAVCKPDYGFTAIGTQANPVNVTITSETNTTATVSIISNPSAETSGAGLAKIDFTNLSGMEVNDQNAEVNSPWRIRHDEAIPSLSETTIPSKQDYTIATNGNVWRALKNNGNGIFEVTDNTTFNDITNAINSNKIVMMKQHDGIFVGLSHADSTKYTFDHIYDNTHITYTIDSNDHTSFYGRALWYGGVRLYLDYRQIQSLNPTVELRLSESENMKVNKYAEDAQFGEDVYILYPSQSYIYYIDHDDTTVPETYEFTPTSNDAPFIRQRLKKLEIKFNVNVSNAQIDFYSATGGTHITDTISGTSKTINRVLNTAWIISKPGYSSQSGTIDVLQESSQRIVINVTLEEESE